MIFPGVDYDTVGEMATIVEDESNGGVRATSFEYGAQSGVNYRQGFIVVFHGSQDSRARVAEYAQSWMRKEYGIQLNLKEAPGELRWSGVRNR
jgi:hypothetical protein